MNVWAELGLEGAVRDEAAVRRAYALRLKSIDRSDAQAFGRLRDAYARALALALAAQAETAPDNDSGPAAEAWDAWDDERDDESADERPATEDLDQRPDRAAAWARLDAFAERFRAAPDLTAASAAVADFFDRGLGLDLVVRDAAEDWLFRLAMDGGMRPELVRRLASRFDWLAADSLPAQAYPEALSDLVERLEAYAFLAELEAAAAALTADMPPGAPERIAAALLGPPQAPPKLGWRDRFLYGQATAWTRHPSLAEALARAERFLPWLDGRIDPRVVERMQADYVGPQSAAAPDAASRKQLLWVAGVAALIAAVIVAVMFATQQVPGSGGPNDGRGILHATASSWVVLDERPGSEPVLYFTHLLAYRGALREIRYGVNGPPDRSFPFPPAPETPTVAPIDNNTPVLTTVPAGTRFVTVEIVYKNGDRDGPVTVLRAGDLGEVPPETLSPQRRREAPNRSDAAEAIADG